MKSEQESLQVAEKKGRGKKREKKRREKVKVQSRQNRKKTALKKHPLSDLHLKIVHYVQLSLNYILQFYQERKVVKCELSKWLEWNEKNIITFMLLFNKI